MVEVPQQEPTLAIGDDDPVEFRYVDVRVGHGLSGSGGTDHSGDISGQEVAGWGAVQEGDETEQTQVANVHAGILHNEVTNGQREMQQLPSR
jgi:hypothetical protein